MKAITSILILVLGLFTGLDTEKPDTVTITVTVSGIRNANGYISVALDNGEGDFPPDEPFMADYVDAENGSVEIVFEDVPAGEYAIAVMHDENGNEEMDMTEYGMPLEGFGFSNDAMGNQGPPDFSDASFDAEDDTDQSIQLIYMN